MAAPQAASKPLVAISSAAMSALFTGSSTGMVQVDVVDIVGIGVMCGDR
jgi:hypothetical protein